MPIASPYSAVMANQGKSSSSDPKGKKDYSTAILERKKSPNWLEVNEATNDDNSAVALHPDTMELFQLSHSIRILPRLPNKPNPYSVHGPAPRCGPSEAPLEPAEQSPPRSRVGALPSENRPTPPRSRPPSTDGISNSSAHPPNR
jgi:hypothetical protein